MACNSSFESDGLSLFGGSAYSSGGRTDGGWTIPVEVEGKFSSGTSGMKHSVTRRTELECLALR